MPVDLSDVGVKIAESGVRLVLGFLVTALVVRRLGPERFGTFTFVWSWYVIATAAVGLGVDHVLQRRIAVTPTATAAVLRAVVTVRLMSSVIGGVCLVATAAFTGRNGGARIGLIVVAFGLALSLSESFVFLLQARDGSSAVGRIRLVAFACGAAVRVSVALLHPSVPALIGATLLEPAVLGALAARTVRLFPKAERQGRQTDWTMCKSLISDGLPFLASALCVMVYMRIDVILLHRWSTDRQVGIYGAATRISELAYFIPLAVAGAVTPRLLAAYSADPANALRAVHRYTAVLSALAAGFVASVWFVGPTALHLAFGNGFTASGPVLQIHVWSCLGVFVGVMREAWFLATNRGYLTLICTASGAVINVAMNAALIPHHGAQGAALSTAVAYIVAAFIVPLFFTEGRRFLGVSRAR